LKETQIVKKSLLFEVALAAATILGSTFEAAAADKAQPVIAIKPPIAAAESKPPPDAQQAQSIGSGELAVDTANNPGDTDSFMVEALDIDGDGDVEVADVLWDDEDMILYLYDELGVDCALTDEVASTSLLIALALNEDGSVNGGWWAAALDAGECGVAATDIYGCDFDASGAATECRVVGSIANDDVVYEDD